MEFFSLQRLWPSASCMAVCVVYMAVYDRDCMVYGLFAFMAVCDVYGCLYGCLRRLCLQRVWLFASWMAVCDVYGFCDVYGCLQRLWLFAACMAACDVYGCLRVSLFASYGCLRRVYV